MLKETAQKEVSPVAGSDVLLLRGDDLVLGSPDEPDWARVSLELGGHVQVYVVLYCGAYDPGEEGRHAGYSQGRQVVERGIKDQTLAQ